MTRHLALLLLSASVFAQQPGMPSNHDHLQCLEYLVGGTWVAQGEMPGMGAYTVERTYRWTLNQNFIEQHHVMKMGTMEMEVVGLIDWDAEKGKLAAWGFGNDGEVAASQADPGEKEVVFLGTRTGGTAGGETRGTYRKVGNDEFAEAVEMRKGDGWVPFLQFHFTRK